MLPALLLAACGWAVPRLLARVFPEGVWPLMFLALHATLVMLALSALVFVGLYLWRGLPLAVLFEAGIGAGLVHFGRLALGSALIWGPILVLSVAGLPARWKHETW